MKSMADVIEKLDEVLGGTVSEEQRKHFTHLRDRAREHQNKRAKVRNAKRRMTRASRKANRG